MNTNKVTEAMRMRQVALYVGETGHNTYPLTQGEEAPRTYVSKSGEVRELKMIHEVPEVSESDRATAHAMAVAS